ncbi:Glycine betaine/L-proline ABC transporter,substrate-binding periplasmic protein [uncultured Alphaproteobacteria bacterium]|uniref:Glycine betaine/L-proline ABC transporter,substrate-binding periplasmic protein n=1 Tax=uncultured Alphaproteobacteria bacterium TaxID=91750 RepID=A0A212JLT8_9PROT|nr:Glycine betaine/L-proline ABC transporter,substrate-binding periplasmic protein [uncultured Alphaproteobacteria bacterium]
MNLFKSAGTLAIAAACLAPLPAAAAPRCEIDRPVVFAALDWDSAAFHTALARFVTETGYGCKTSTIPGSSIPLLNGMAHGDVDVTMEQWIGVLGEAWRKAEATGNVRIVGVAFDDATQGWYVPRYLVEGPDAPAPGLKSVADLPRYKDLFRDPEEPSKGRFYNGIAGWGAEIVNTRKLQAYGLDADYTNFRPGTGAALSSAIASAFKRKKPILFYYWGPTWVLGRYDSVMLEEPAYDEKIWEVLNSDKPVGKATAFPTMKVYTTANTRFIAQAPKLVAFLDKFRTSNAEASRALVRMRELGGTDAAETVAKQWLRDNPATWSAWMPADVAARVKAAL